MTFFIDGKIYIVLFSILFLIAFLEPTIEIHRAKKIFAYITMLIMSLFIGLRWQTGTDWIPYKNLFDTLQLNWSFLINVYHFDIGYVLLNAIIRVFTENYTVFLIINSFITIYVLYRLIIKLSPYPNLSLFMFYSAYMLAQFMGSNRRMMAMVFLLWGFYYFYKNNKKWFLFFVILAFLFHRSAIIGLILFYIPKKQIKIYQIVCILIFCFLLGVFRIPFRLMETSAIIISKIVNHPILDTIIYYSKTNEQHLTSSTGSIIIQTILAVAKKGLFLAFYFFILYCNRFKIDKLTGYMLNIYVIGFAGYLMFIGVFFQVLTAYFMLMEIILLARMYKYISNNNKIFFINFMGVYGFVQMISALYVYPHLYLPYISRFSSVSR
jgi:hypothetical protein